LEAAAAAAREEGVEREAVSTAAAEEAAAKLEALQSRIDAMQLELVAEQQVVVKQAHQLAVHAGTAASFSQQRTLDGKIISGIDTIAKVYEALKLVLDKDGQRFDKQYTTTSFVKDFAELTARRTRTLMHSLEPAIMAVLGAFHPDKEELLQLFAFHKRSSSSASQELSVAQYAEMPMVKDAVEAYNRSQSVKEREQILSTLVFTFTRDQLNNLDFDEAVSRYRFHHARAHSRAFGAGMLAPNPNVHRFRVNVTQMEEAYKFISDPENMQQVAYGTKAGWCRLLVSKPVLKAPIVSAFSTVTS